MCYVALSAPEDLNRFRTEHLQPAFVAGEDRQLQRSWFSLPSIYYLGSKSGCSCEIRTWGHTFGFVPPQEWANERDDDDGVIAAREIYRMLRHLLQAGTQVQMVMKWWDEPLLKESFLDVDLMGMKETEFYVINDYKIRFTASSLGPST